MAVIAELSVPAEDFTLGQILTLDPGERVVLETMVPLGETLMHFFWIHGGRKKLADTIRSDPLVKDLH